MLQMFWRCHLLLLLALSLGCHGDQDMSMHHLVLLDDLPSEFSLKSTPEIVVRTNFSGSVQFKESEDFKVLLNITASTVNQAYAVQSELVENKGRLLLQVFEKPVVTPTITLPWIFVIIGIATAGILFLTSLYAIWWYCSKQYVPIEKDLYSHGNVMYRSRNSMHLSSSQGGEPLLLQSEDNDNINNEDTLREVPEMPEEEEAEARKMEAMHAKKNSDHVEGNYEKVEDRVFVKQRYHSPSKKIHRELFKRDAKRKRHPSLNDPPSYNTVMEYPNESSEESDGEPGTDLASQEPGLVDSVQTLPCDRNYQNMYQSSDKNARQELDLPVTHSDSDLARRYSGRVRVMPNLPPTAKGLVTPVHGSDNLEQGQLSRVQKLDNFTEEQTQNNLSREDSNRSPFNVTAVIHQGKTTDNVPTMQIRRNKSPLLPQPLVLDSIGTDKPHPMDIPLTSFKGPSSKEQTPDSAVDESEDVLSKLPNGQTNYGRISSPVGTPGLLLEPPSPGGYRYASSPEPSPGAYRYSIMSDRTLSMYGSSEIFDANNPDGHGYFDDRGSDIDVEIPPLESDADVLSEVSLPLPSPPPFAKVPPNVPLSPRRPVVRSTYPDSPKSPITISAVQWEDPVYGGTFIAATASPTNTLDRHFQFPSQPYHSQIPEQGLSQDSNTDVPEGDGSLFLPPPPPKLYHPPQRYSWNRDSGGRVEYAKIQKPTQPQQVDRQTQESPVGDGSRAGQSQGSSRSGGGKPLNGAKQLHLAIVSTLCFMSLMTGVYCKMTNSDPQVHITIYAPKSFISSNITVYFNRDNPGEVVDPPSKLHSYDLRDPILVDKETDMCEYVTCAHGCDENNGQCICKKGYRLDKTGNCVDINECHERTFRCHPDAGCLDTEGSYDCICSKKYYGDGKHCEKCSAPCRDGTYQEQPCLDGQQKICRDCTESCKDGFYMLTPCDREFNLACGMCHSKCSDDQFEYRRCTESQNRLCKDRTSLPGPVTSNNIITEEKAHIETGDSIEMPYVPSSFVGTRIFTFKRASGFHIEVAVKYINPVVTLEPVDHSDDNDLDSFHGTDEILHKYCPYPVPHHYRLLYLVHRNMTYRSRLASASYIEPCQTYQLHGGYPDPSRSPLGSFMCTEPGPVSSVFDVEKEFVTTKDTWVELSESCDADNEMCSNCTRECARYMMTSGGDCSVRGEDQDNGWSPRLHKCYTCCVEMNCSDVCDDYHNIHCHPIRCSRGNLVEFQLRPTFKKNEFLCHVTPVTNQKLMVVEYTIMHYYETLVKKNFSVMANDVWKQTGKQTHRDDMVQIDLDTKLEQIPDFIKGYTNSRNISVGLHRDNGSSVKNVFINGQMALIRPTKPFGLTASKFGKKNCEDEVLQDTVLTTDSDDPFSPISQYVGMNHSNRTYTIHHQTALPNIKIGVDKHLFFLTYLYELAEIDFKRLKGNITHNSTHLVLTLQGQIKTCPGMLYMNISIPEYPQKPLYQYAVAIKCPKTFKFTFPIPNGDKPEDDREFVIAIRDKTTLHHLNLYKPAARVVTVTEQQGQSSTSSSTGSRSSDIAEPPHFSVPFIASVCGSILLLLFIAAFGIAIKFGQPEGDVLRFHFCQLFFMIGYVTFNFIYAVFVSMTVFVLIIIAVNSDTASFLKNFHQQRSVKSAFSHLELDHMELHLQAELQRQNRMAAQTMTQCQTQMQTVIGDLNNIKKGMEKEAMDKLDRQNVKNLMNVHMNDVLKEFTDNLSILMERYNSYVLHTQKSFVTNIQETYRSVEKNKWLKGADFLHKTVKNLRDLTGASTKPFMDWAGFQVDLNQLTTDSVMPLPRLPNFDDVLNINVHPGSRSSRRLPPDPLPLEMTAQTHNIWVYKKSSLPSIKNGSADMDDKDVTMKTESWNMNSYYLFFGVMVFIDLIWFLHRMLKILGVGQLLLYGYPIFVDIRDKTDGPSTDDLSTRKLCKSGVCDGCKEFMFKILSSMFVPKVIATIFVCLSVYLISVATHHFVNRETFSYLGYYNNMNDMLRLHEKFINNRIEGQANRINTLEYPAYQDLMNNYIRHHHYLFSMQERQWRQIGHAHSRFYCNYLKSMDVNAVCETDGPIKFDNLQFTACHFKRILPKTYKSYSGSDSRVAEIQMDAFLTRIRQLISDTCYIILIYLSTVVIKELLGTVVWLYMKRSGFINLRIIYEADEPPPPRQAN